jgi:hypothetical protein
VGPTASNEGGQSMSGWLENPLVVMGFMGYFA